MLLVRVDVFNIDKRMLMPSIKIEKKDLSYSSSILSRCSSMKCIRQIFPHFINLFDGIFYGLITVKCESKGIIFLFLQFSFSISPLPLKMKSKIWVVNTWTTVLWILIIWFQFQKVITIITPLKEGRTKNLWTHNSKHITNPILSSICT